MEKNIEYHKKSPNIKQILTVIGAHDIQASCFTASLIKETSGGNAKKVSGI